MGLVNWVVPPDKLEEETLKICREMLQLSPTALHMCKLGFNADLAQLSGINELAMHDVELFYSTEESAEGGKAFLEKRPPNYAQFR